MFWFNQSMVFLASVGAINWGLVAFFKFNLVEYLFKLIGLPKFSKYLYGLVAIAGFYTLLLLFKP